MKFTLRDYQRQAAADVLRNVRRGLRDYREDHARSSFSLAALTGAGKTVIATAVIEALLHGSADLETDPVPSTSFLWVTDDPALNRQTLDRMLQASDIITVGQLVIIDESFDQKAFEPGRVYFLNTQKLYSGTGYVKSRVDGREFSLWDTVANTVKAGSTDLVLVLDEAHKGMKPGREKKSTVRELIDGRGCDREAAVPVVWGISATVARFEDAMQGTANRTHYEAVVVDNDLIRASGLVKDRVVLDSPKESGIFDTTLLRSAVQDLQEMDRRWNAYTSANGLPDVKPVMVVQVPDKASDAKLGEIVSVIGEEWSGLPDAAFVHVLGEHSNKKLAGREVKYISPERIEDNTDARIVLAKEAITTGWDCPRAEVLYSERPGKDETHIAQLIGRIVRTPLAKAVTGDERLSQVFCYLPNFDDDTVQKVVARLESGDDAVPVVAVRKTGDFTRVGSFKELGVYELLATTPCEPAPAVNADPVRRAKQLAAHLSGDRLVEGAIAQLESRLNQKLDGLAAEHAQQVAKNVKDILDAHVQRTVYSYAGGAEQLERHDRHYRTDAANVEDAYKVMSRRIKEGVVEVYRKHRASAIEANGDEVDMVEVRAQIAALLMVDGVVEAVEQTAEEWTKTQLQANRVAIRGLGPEQHAAYSEIEGQASAPERVDVELPDIATATIEDAKGAPVDRWQDHVYQGGDGLYAAKLNDWEQDVLGVERGRQDFVAWYRNPSTAIKSAVRIAYQDAGKWKSLQPDFIVVSRKADGALVRSIVDPHGDHLADALPKLQALADYAERYAEELHRVESLAKVGEELRVLDLTDGRVREAVRAFGEPGSVNTLYSGEHSRPYV